MLAPLALVIGFACVVWIIGMAFAYPLFGVILLVILAVIVFAMLATTLYVNL